MAIKPISLILRHASLGRVVASLRYNRDALAEMPDDADIKRFREKGEICLLKVQELRAEMADLIEELEAQ
jgi:hypothetical protein